MLLPAYREEGKAHLAIGLGCTGGQHRSVMGGESLAQALDVPGAKATLVDITGKSVRTGQPSRTVVVVVPGGSGNWIYKMTGDPAIVEQEKATLIQFVQSARYPND